MKDFLYQRRFTVFLVSFLILLFGDILFTPGIRDEVQTFLLLQNMACSALLFRQQPKIQQILIGVVIFLGFITRLNQQYLEQNHSFFFAATYFGYFTLISLRLFRDLRKQKAVGIETISAVFSGFILLGFLASILFASLDNNFPGAFAGMEKREFSDFLYFSFITLLTIGYGDIVPSAEISKKMVVFVGLLGHFYTVFVVAIIVGKYLNQPDDRRRLN